MSALGWIMIYKRKLKQSESERYYIYISEESSDMFPPQGKKFDVTVGNKRFEVRIDKYRRIWANYFWQLFPSFKQGDTVVITKNKDGSYNVDVEKWCNQVLGYEVFEKSYLR